jgi:hypothetical protein
MLGHRVNAKTHLPALTVVRRNKCRKILIMEPPTVREKWCSASELLQVIQNVLK